MNPPLLHIIQQNHFWFSGQRAIFWEEEKALIVSDTHFGKTGHFRKHGIAVPQQIFKEDLQRFISLVTDFKVEKIIVVGDLFHSVVNEEMNFFLKWRNDLSGITFILVRGNHDILYNTWYEKAGITVQEGIYRIGDFQFVHDAAEIKETDNTLFTFSGHLHPGIAIRGNAKQNLTFPCFYCTPQQCILPAFSKFSGLKIMKKKKGNQVFLLNKGEIIQL